MSRRLSLFELDGEGSRRIAGSTATLSALRVRDLAASRSFYEAVAAVVGLRLREGAENRFHVVGLQRSFALVREDR